MVNYDSMDPKYLRLRNNTFYVFLGNAGSRMIGFLLLPFYTHYLSPTEYGITDILNTYSSILLPLVTCCIADAIFIFPKGESKDVQSRFYSSGLVFSSVTFAIAAFCFWIIGKIAYSHSVSGAFFTNLWWIFGMTATTYLQTYTQQFTRSIDKMKVFSATGVIQTVATALYAFILLPRYGIDGYLWSLIFASLTATIYSFAMSRSYTYLSVRSVDKGSLRILLAYSLPLIPNSLMWWFVNGVNRPMMESALGLSAIGIFSVSNRFPNILNMLFTIFSNAWGISMLEEFNKPDFTRFYNQALKMLTLVLVLGGMLLSVSSKLIISIFAASEFYEAWRFIPFLTISVVFQCLSCIVGGVFSAAKKSKYFFYSSIWGASFSLLCTYILIHLWGLFGACFATMLSFLIILTSRIIYAWKYTDGFNIKYYTLIFIIYVLQVTVVTVDVSDFISLFITFLAVLIMFYINKDILVKIIKQIKK